VWRKLIVVIGGLVIGPILGVIAGLKFSDHKKIEYLDYERMWVI